MPAKPKPRPKSQTKTPSSPAAQTVYRYTARLTGGPFALV